MLPTHQLHGYQFILSALILATSARTVVAGCTDLNTPQAVGTETQIFVDDAMIASKSGVARKVHPCRKLPQTALASEKPWEQDGIDRRVYVYGTVLFDPRNEQFRLWYNRMHLVLYATSTDGLRWHRPELGICDFAGSKRNNIVFSHFHSPSVVYDQHEADPAQRYKMLGYSKVAGRGYYAAHSADGIRWKLYPKNPVLPSGDTCTLSLDPETGEYLAFHKRTHAFRGKNRRLVYLAVSRDMQNWTEPQLVMAPDEMDDSLVKAEGGLYSQFYNMSVFPYGGQFLGLVTHFRYTGPPKERGPLQSGCDGPVDVQLVHSRDGRSWHRCEDRSPVVPNGPHAYDAGCVLGVTNGPVIVGDEMWFYYSAITTTHGGYVPKKQIAIARAAWRLDGLVSLDAGDDGGIVETVPLQPAGDRLVVNADAGNGALTVAVLDRDGAAIGGYDEVDCVPLHVDSVRHVTRWKQHDRLPSDRAVRLRFHLRNAKMYSFAIKNN